ncbi:MAG: peptidoglycan-binding protein [Syntrophomonas sp.]|nr:peptidoglycan-binding protein [Syntrophomonas sp.]
MAFNYFGSRILRINSSGDDVRVLQTLLNKLPDSIATPVTVDGTFGASTQASVKRFQRYFGLTADGVVGRNTFLYFGQQSGANAFGSRTLRNGSTGNDVTILQNRLAGNLKRYAAALGNPADGQFGTKTDTAVKFFQGDNDLTVDGIVGRQTFNELYVETNYGGRILQKDRTDRNQGYDVYFLQERLRELGYYTGALDGKFGPVTEAAVKALQTASKIGVDGVVGSKTYYYLGR